MNLSNNFQYRKGIRLRLIGSYFLVTLIAVFIFVSSLLYVAKQYYMYNIESILYTTLEACSSFYNNTSYFEKIHIETEKIGYDLSRHTSAQVQLLDMNGIVLYDSINPQIRGTKINYSDINKTIAYGEGKYCGNMNNTQEKILSMSRVLIFQDAEVGILRFTTSLSDISSILYKIALFLICIGIMVVIIVTIISLLITNSIISPIIKITQAAKTMTTGNFDIKLEKVHDDELGTLTDVLNFLAQEISKTQKLQNDFIASISHELRTPLTSIKGWSITLMNLHMEKGDDLDNGLLIIEQETDRLIELVNDLLDFSRLSCEELTLNINKLNINNLISYIVKQMKPRAKRIGIDLVDNISHAPVIIEADKNRIKQVIINILDNAFKFTPKNGTVTVKTLLSDYFYITIEDTGCGIEKTELRKVMNKFYKVNKNEGTGLGLSISNEIIKKHKGSIYIDSEFNVGTKVTLKLPLK